MSEGYYQFSGWWSNASVIVFSRSVLSHSRISGSKNCSAWCPVGGHRMRPPRFARWCKCLGSRITHLLRPLTLFNMLETLTHKFCFSPISHNCIAVRKWYTILMCRCSLWLILVSCNFYREPWQQVADLQCFFQGVYRKHYTGWLSKYGTIRAV